MEQRTPTIIEHEADSPKKSHSRGHYIKDSGHRIQNIARDHGLDALISEEKIEVTPLDRALKREHKRKEQRQRNLESIVRLAHKSCKNETAGDPDQDWLYRFFDMAQDIHNSSMQRLWAQVLKREVTNPGSTSMKALRVLKDMTPKEAQILQKSAALACSFGNDNSRKLLVGLRAHNGIFTFGKRDVTITLSLGSFQLPYSSLLVLIELGLLHATELESGEIEQESALSFHYQGKNLSLQAMNRGIHLLYYRFSPTGNELCKLLGNKLHQQYYDQMIALLGQKFMVHTDVTGSIHHTV
ncbi:TIGR03899 family protein [Vibrio mangrovi]|nr:TIGR03899 family protein [Vibrio mangrovi]MDW6002822.1 TIGR03899 family protein [Vibrio mangrovi]